MILIIFALTLQVSSELINYHISINSPNYFDSNYIILSKNYGSEKIFGYDKNEACFIRVNPMNIVAYTQESRTFKRTSSMLFENSKKSKEIEIKNCFKYKEDSYIIYRIKNTNETVIIKGKNNIKKFTTLIYDDIKFDYILNKMYFIHNFTIYEVEMKFFEEIWEANNYVSNGILKINPIEKLDQKTTDLIIIGNVIFLIKEGQIFKKKIYDNEYIFVAKTNSLEFNYALFEMKPSIKSGDGKYTLNLFYALFEIVIVLLCIYLINYLKLFKKKKYGQVSIEMDVLNEKRQTINSS